MVQIITNFFFSSIHGNAFDGGFSDFTLQQINTRNERL